jgi:Na+-translocating ferredoxin:NAD+ oxidoreductase RnfC subunit
MPSTRDALAARLDAAGVADARGRRLTAAALAARVVIGRVCDDEPLLETELAVGRAAPERLLRGLAAVGLLAGAERLLLAASREAPDLCAGLERAAAGTRAEVVRIVPRAPLDAASLICDLAAPAGPIAAGLDGALLVDAVTLADAADALEGRVLGRRTLTLVGELARPALLEAALGATVADLVAACGGSPDPGWVAFENGVVAGRRAPRAQSVELTTRGFVILPHDHPLLVRAATPLVDELRRAASACAQCRVCSDCCPVRLNGGRLDPPLVIRALAGGASAALLASLECGGCGVCSALCPASLRPAELVREAARRLAQAGVSLADEGRALQPAADSVLPQLRLRRDPNRAGRRLTPARLMERLGLARYARGLAPRAAQVIPERLTIAARSADGGRRVPTVRAGERVAAGAVVALAPAGSQAPDCRAPLAGVVHAVDPDDGVVIAPR